MSCRSEVGLTADSADLALIHLGADGGAHMHFGFGRYAPGSSPLHPASPFLSPPPFPPYPGPLFTFVLEASKRTETDGTCV